VILIATVAVKLLPKGPSPLFGVVVAVVVAAAFGWHEKEVGRLPLEIPPFAGFVWQPSDVWKVLPQAFGLAFVTSVNLLVTSRIVDHFRGRHHHFDKADADAELGVYGIANIVAGMFGAPMSVGIPARSLANVQCGGTTRMSNLMHGFILLGFLTLGSAFISQIPLAALAGVTAWMGFRLLDWSTWRRLAKMRRVDAAAFLSTACAVLVVNAVAAVAIGWALYALRAAYLRLAPQPRVIKATAKPAAAGASEPK
jgi:SulP family sulfate permease